MEVYKSGMEQALIELEEMKMVCKPKPTKTSLDSDMQSQNQGDTDTALDTQIDHVLHGAVSKINDIIDSVLQAGVQRVDDALYELDSTMQAGNQNASPPYVLSQIEKASASATEFSTAFNNFIADGPNSPHAEIIRTVTVFSGSIADVLSNTKGLVRFANDDKSADQLINSARKSAQATARFFRGLQSFRLEGLDALKKTDVVINNNLEVQRDLQSLSKLVDAFAPKSSKLNTSGDLGEMVDQELNKTADAIDAAAERLAKLKNKPREGFSTYELRINDSILEAAIAVTNAIAELIKAATISQQEIVREGRGSSSKTAFYKKNNRWTEGLISAAKAVASSTNTLIETADGVISGRNSPEQLIVASNDVAASTAQLVAASRVKATFMSKTQDRLEAASRAVGAACRKLVRQVQDIIAERHKDETETVDYAKLSAHEFKVQEMEQQVRFLSFIPSFLCSCFRSLFMYMEMLTGPYRSKSCSWRTALDGRANVWERCARSRTKRIRESDDGGCLIRNIFVSFAFCFSLALLLRILRSIERTSAINLSVSANQGPEPWYRETLSVSVCVCQSMSHLLSESVVSVSKSCQFLSHKHSTTRTKANFSPGVSACRSPYRFLCLGFPLPATNSGSFVLD